MKGIFSSRCLLCEFFVQCKKLSKVVLVNGFFGCSFLWLSLFLSLQANLCGSFFAVHSISVSCTWALFSLVPDFNVLYTFFVPCRFTTEGTEVLDFEMFKYVSFAWCAVKFHRAMLGSCMINGAMCGL